MKPENQVTSLELSQKLKELRVKTSYFKSLYVWVQSQGNLRNNTGEIWATDIYAMGGLDPRQQKEVVTNAFTVAELGEMLPDEVRAEWGGVETWKIRIVKNKGRWQIGYYSWKANDWYKTSFLADTEADCRAKMLIYLLENKLITF